MDGLGQAILGFIERNQDWTPWIMVLFAAAETTAFLSFLIPSTAVLAGVGALVATGAIPFLPLWLGASAGALIGSCFSYWLGVRYGGTILAMKPMSNYPELVGKGRAAFDKWGPVAVFIGHFTSPLRPVVFLMAGMSGMGFARFLAFNVPGALLWAYLVPKLGEVGGVFIAWIWQYLPF